MPAPPDPFDEFLRKVAPLMQSPPVCQSLKFACVAARHDSEWILISGKAVLNAAPCASVPQLVQEVLLPDMVALRGCIPAEGVNDLIGNLRDSWFVRDLDGDKVRLTAEGARRYIWTRPAVSLVNESWNPSCQWIREFALYGKGTDPSSLLSDSTLQEIDSELRRSPSAFTGFDELCGALGLPARQTTLTPSLQISAELPAQFGNVYTHPSKRVLEIDIECIGAPGLIVKWFPGGEVHSVPADWKREPTGSHHHVSLDVPGGKTAGNLILYFGELEADISEFNLQQWEGLTRDAQISIEEAESDGSAALQLVEGDDLPNQGYGRWADKGPIDGGGQGDVILVEDTLREFSEWGALKKLKNIHDPKARERFEREVEAVRSIRHTNIVNIIDCNLADEQPYYVAEYCERGSLEKNGASAYYGDIKATRNVVLPILDALVAAHNIGIIHRDIKPPNILIRGDGTPAIGDFGICFMEGEERLTFSNEAVGSKNFIAPEMESNQHHRFGDPSDQTDVYSLGKVIYWMLSGGDVFAREDFPLSLADLFKDQRFEHVDRLLKQMVRFDPAERIHSHEVKVKLETVASLVEGSSELPGPLIGLP